ncbi:MAG: peptidyl-prolyl cis-trans isomerase [Ignavibacteria bacterium]|nr:peptidyl-prolyl cis-trans isomerase [Ignavibacteria bacterium]
MRDVSLWLACLLPLVVLACQRRQAGTVIARVGDAELTLEEARTHIDTSRTIVDGQLRNYVMHWVNEELVYQDAKRSGIVNDDQVKRQLDEAKRQLVNQTYLEQMLYGDSSAISDHTLREYFNKHAVEFFVREDMIKLNLIAFSNRERASSFAALVSRGSSWRDAVETIRRDTTTPASINADVMGQYYTMHTLFPTELWKVASSLNDNDASFPEKTSTGYCVIQPLANVKKGKPAEFDLVRDEIRQRVVIERRRQRYDVLLGTLRKQYNVQILLDLKTSPDTIQQSHHE